MHMCTQSYAHRYQRRMSGVLLHHSPLYSHEIGSLTEPGARLAASKPSDAPVSGTYGAGITGTYDYAWHFPWVGVKKDT